MVEDLNKLVNNLSVQEIYSLARTNSQFVELVRKIYKEQFQLHLTGCINCIVDAVAEILHKNKIMKKEESQFEIPRGVVHNDSSMAISKRLSVLNINDDLCFYHLDKNQDVIKKFSKYPKDWKEQLKAWKEEKEKAYKTPQISAEEIGGDTTQQQGSEYLTKEDENALKKSDAELIDKAASDSVPKKPEKVVVKKAAPKKAAAKKATPKK